MTPVRGRGGGGGGGLKEGVKIARVVAARALFRLLAPPEVQISAVTESIAGESFFDFSST